MTSEPHHADEAAEPLVERTDELRLDRLSVALHAPMCCLEAGRQEVPHDRPEQLLLRREVEVQALAAEARGARDLLHRGLAVTKPHERGEACIEETPTAQFFGIVRSLFGNGSGAGHGGYLDELDKVSPSCQSYDHMAAILRRAARTGEGFQEFRDGRFRNASNVQPVMKGNPLAVPREFFFGGKRHVRTERCQSGGARWRRGRARARPASASRGSATRRCCWSRRLRVLTDPVWGDRASPVTFAGPKRFQPVPVPHRASCRRSTP